MTTSLTKTDPARANSQGETSFATGSNVSEAFVLLDNSSGDGVPALLFTDPVDIAVAETPDDISAALRKIEDARAAGLHAAGFFSYELGYALEPRLRRRMPTTRAVPLLWFGLYREPQSMTGREVETWLETHTKSASHRFSDVRLDWDEADYLQRFAEVQDRIRAGDIYQLNLTFKARFKLEGSPLTFYRDLRRKQNVAHGGIIDTGQVTILSASPELFVARNGDVIETRPMKGTAARKGQIAEDAEQRVELATDAKQRAENLMIVDLMRNDIGRISETGSVSVTDLFTIETYKTLHQMTSGVRAQLKPGLDLLTVLRAIFPPGSVTGAPKIRAMELIEDLENEARGIYCGSIGYLAPDGREDLNVVIRTPVVFRDGTGEMGIGSGVVFDSDGASEYAECLLKMKFLTDPPKPFQLIETMLFEPDGGLWLWDGHMDRLSASAAYFGFPFDRAVVVRAVEAAIEGAGRDRRLRVRLTVNEDGSPQVTTTHLGPAPTNPVMRYVVSPTRLNSANPFLYHKTTRRELYDEEWAHYSAAVGSDEVIYLNEDGDLAEGSRTTIFVEQNEVLLTPPLGAGLLPGVLRSDLIARGRAVEARLTLRDLQRRGRVFLGNSVRGLVPAKPLG
ncbi:MAG: aminodeoxychorismate synthase component I [Pseudomonadota bacterium]